MSIVTLPSRSALEAVAVQQREEELEVLLLAACGVAVISRKWRDESAELLAELVALGLLDLIAEVVGRHLVRLVDDHQVPVADLASLARRSSLRDS